jgi:hypothetical protein
MKELSKECIEAIESYANKIKPFIPMKNGLGEEIVQRVGQNAAGSKKHSKLINKFINVATEALTNPSIYEKASLVTLEDALGTFKYFSDMRYDIAGNTVFDNNDNPVCEVKDLFTIYKNQK